MPQAARAQDPWSDEPPRRPRRRPVDSWASPDDLEILGSIGRPREADWTVLTLERDDELLDDPDGLPEGAPMARRALRVVEDADDDGRVLDEPHDFDEPDAMADPSSATSDGRRTVVIRGQVADRQALRPTRRDRPARRPSQRVGHRPDRVALWAVGLALLLILVAILSAGGA